MGGFFFSLDYTKLKISGDSNIPGKDAPRSNPDGEHIVINLDEDVLNLHVTNDAGGTG